MRLQRLLIALLSLGCASVAGAQETKYTPRQWQFDHEPAEFDKTGAYLIEVKRQQAGGADIVVGRWELPKDKLTVVATGVPCAVDSSAICNTYAFDASVYPALPAGTTYVMTLAAKGVSTWDGTSEFTVSPDQFRIQTCVGTDGKLKQPSVTIRPLTLPVTRDKQYTLPVDIISGHPVVSAVIDLPADGKPAWYFAGTNLENGGEFIIGPFARAARFQITIRTVDSFGCEGSLPGIQYLNVVP